MSNPEPNLAPEPYLRGALYLLYQVSLIVRNEAHNMPSEQLSDLADAVHNIPDSIYWYGKSFDEKKIREHFLVVYDEKWCRDSEPSYATRSLCGILDYGMSREESYF